VKEWVKFARGANGKRVVTVSVQEGNLSARWSTVAYTTIKAGVADARKEALAALAELKEAMQ
jgi:hypothetical protein